MTSSKFRVCSEYVDRCCSCCSEGDSPVCGSLDHTSFTEQRNLAFALYRCMPLDRESGIAAIVVATIAFVALDMPYVTLLCYAVLSLLVFCCAAGLPLHAPHAPLWLHVFPPCGSLLACLSVVQSGSIAIVCSIATYAFCLAIARCRQYRVSSEPDRSSAPLEVWAPRHPGFFYWRPRALAYLCHSLKPSCAPPPPYALFSQRAAPTPNPVPSRVSWGCLPA